MKSTVQQLRSEAGWPPEEGEVISFKSSTALETATLKEVRWGLVWRDFILEDGRVIPEHRVSGCPRPQVWRKIDEVTDSEREECEGGCFRWRESASIRANGTSHFGRN